LGDAALDVVQVRLLGVEPCVDGGRLARDGHVAGQRVLDVGAAQEAVDAYRVQHHQDSNEGGQGEPE
jgi:hypothetical protein